MGDVFIQVWQLAPRCNKYWYLPSAPICALFPRFLVEMLFIGVIKIINQAMNAQEKSTVLIKQKHQKVLKCQK